MNFNTNSGNFKARYTLNKAVTGPTVVYLNEDYWYPNGYAWIVEIDGEEAPKDSFTFDTSDVTRLSITFAADTTYDGKQISISVKASVPPPSSDIIILQ